MRPNCTFGGSLAGHGSRHTRSQHSLECAVLATVICFELGGSIVLEAGHSSEAIGTEAARLLVDWIRHERQPELTPTVHLSLVLRGSTAQAPK